VEVRNSDKMNFLHDDNLQQILTRVQPRIHENMVHLVSTRFHRLMLRSVDLDICITQSMDEEVRQTYIRDIITTLSSVGKIHMLNLYSQWASNMEANRVLTRFAFPVVDVSPMATGEAFYVALTTLRLELDNATQLPVNIWHLTALTSLDIAKCMRITSMPACMTLLNNVTFLHVADCTRLAVMKRVPENLDTLRITSCPMFARAPENLQQVLTLTTLELDGLAVKALPDLRMLSKITFLRVATCKNLVRIGELPDALETLIITECHVLTAMPENMQFLFELQTLQVGALPLIKDLGDVSLFSKLQRLDIQMCIQLNMPASLPLSLVFFKFVCRGTVARNWPDNLNLLVELQTFDVCITQNIPADIARLPKLTHLVLQFQTGLHYTIQPLSLQTMHIQGRWPHSVHMFNFFSVNLGELSNLTKLHIADICLPGSTLRQIQNCAALCRARNGVGLTHLSLVNCNMPIAPEWISELVGLQHLDLSKNNMMQFPEQYERLVNLRSLSIGNGIESWQDSEGSVGFSGSIFPSFIYGLPRLEYLDISAFFAGIPALGLGDPFFLTICNIQLERLTHLTSLNMSGNRFRLVCCCFAADLFLSNSLVRVSHGVHCFRLSRKSYCSCPPRCCLLQFRPMDA